MDFVRKTKLCYNCLQQFSKNHACSAYTCKKCNKRHHTLLHQTIHTRPADNSDSSTRVRNNNDTSCTEAMTYCSFKGKSFKHVLLATAVIEVQSRSGKYIKCRALLDSASQLNFITDSCVKRLNLTKQQNNTFIQGINSVNTSTQCSVNINLRSNHTNWNSKVSCAVLPQITEATPTMKLNVSSWKIPSDIQLANPTFSDPGSIDILLGAELFYELLLPERRTKRGHPVLQKTVFGWTLCGLTPQTNTSNSTQQSFFVQDVSNFELIMDRFREVEAVDSTSM